MNSTYSLTVFVTADANVRQSALPDVLYVYPEGDFAGSSINLHMPKDSEQAVRVAEALLLGFQQFRDQVVARAEKERTTTDELAEARAEIARLKAAREGGESR